MGPWFFFLLFLQCFFLRCHYFMHTSCIHVSTILVLFTSFPPCFCDFFSLGLVCLFRSYLALFLFHIDTLSISLIFTSWLELRHWPHPQIAGKAWLWSLLCMSFHLFVSRAHTEFWNLILPLFNPSFHYLTTLFLWFYVFCHCCRINVIAPSLIPHLLLLMPNIYQSIYDLCNHIAYGHLRCKWIVVVVERQC